MLMSKIYFSYKRMMRVFNLEEILMSNSETNLVDVMRKYTDLLYQSDSLRDIEHSNMICQYIQFYENVRKNNNLKHFIKLFGENMDSKLNSLEIVCRIKAFIRFEEKIRLHCQENLSLNEIRDVIGLRVIADVEEEKKLYSILDKIVTFFVKNNCVICSANKVMEQSEYIAEQIKFAVKDYVYNPKDNGYKSIHIVFWSNDFHNFLEVQLRTPEHHLISESLADHDLYKKNRYNKSQINFDFTKITSLKGFKAMKLDGRIQVYDKIGLVRPIIIESL